MLTLAERIKEKKRVKKEKEQNEKELEVLLIERENTVHTMDNVVIDELNKKIEELEQHKILKNVEINAYEE